MGFYRASPERLLTMQNRRFIPSTIALFICILVLSSNLKAADRSNWRKKEVNFSAGAGRRIKAIKYPKGKGPLTREEKKQKKVKKTKPSRTETDSQLSQSSALGPSISVITIESPPVNGFIPWIAVSATDERTGSEDYNAYPEYTAPQTGFYPANPQTDFTVGLYDTGASTHVASYQASQILNFPWTLESGNYVEIAGVTGSVEAAVSNPLGIYIAPLNAVNPETMTLDTSALVGQSNVSIAIGQRPDPGAPDLPTAIGSPMAVYYTAVFDNENEITVHFQGQNYTAPEMYISPSELQDPCVPEYPVKIPLELRPGGAAAVSYIPTLDFGTIETIPASPSVIIGNSSQSLFFVHAVDLYEKDQQAYDKDRFMIDTGAQVTVIGNRVAARLNIDVNNPEFVVDIEGVSGHVSQIGGYFIDLIEIPALGEWVNFTNVPVILLDIASPEGGTLDGIIGMNLFNEYNMVLRGGGMFLQDDPVLELELITDSSTKLTGDIAPNPVDGIVDSRDLTLMMDSWLADSSDPNTNYNPVCDIAPTSISDGKVNLQDFSALSSNWLKTIP